MAKESSELTEDVVHEQYLWGKSKRLLNNGGRCIAIGELHISRAALKFLIDHLEAFASLGVKTFFTEKLSLGVVLEPGLTSETDIWLGELADKDINAIISKYFKKISDASNDTTFIEDISEYYYSAYHLIRKALQCGITVIGIDCACETEKALASDLDENSAVAMTKRADHMNTMALALIERTLCANLESKAIVFAGCCHISDYQVDFQDKVTGLANSLNAAEIKTFSINVFDREAIQVSTEELRDLHQTFEDTRQVEFTLYNGRAKNQPSQYLTANQLLIMDRVICNVTFEKALTEIKQWAPRYLNKIFSFLLSNDTSDVADLMHVSNQAEFADFINQSFKVAIFVISSSEGTSMEMSNEDGCQETAESHDSITNNARLGFLNGLGQRWSGDTDDEDNDAHRGHTRRGSGNSCGREAPQPPRPMPGIPVSSGDGIGNIKILCAAVAFLGVIVAGGTCVLKKNKIARKCTVM